MPAVSGGRPAPPRGVHACHAYRSRAEWAATVTASVREGVAQGQRVHFFADTAEPSAIASLLRSGGVDVDTLLSSGQLRVTDTHRSYLERLPFDPDLLIAGLREACGEAVAQGYPGLRVVGEMNWHLRRPPGGDRLLEYELRVEAEVYADLPLTGICLYDRRDTPSDVLLAAHHLHLSPSLTEVAGVDAPLTAVPLTEGSGLRLRGDADTDTGTVLSAVLDTLPRMPGNVVRLDLSGTRFFGLAAVGALVETAGTIRSQGRRLVLQWPPPSLQRMAELFPDECTVLEVAA
ncbi:MEDS domain-containing protein [Streptomyces sp. NPDC051098]|uniref:MEDS domain-containing protein n=1 Tax=Streptomyces sp. NPDC051098 TaxID=3155411 RepID=UPI00341CDBC9